MKTLIDFFVGLAAFIAALAMSQLGIDLMRNTQPIEITRLPACSTAPDEPEAPAKPVKC